MSPRARRLAALLVLAVALPACAVGPRIAPLDARGMEYPLEVFGGSLREQVHNTGETVTGFPGAVVDHFRTSWRHLTVE